ncbi:polyketide synthase [Micromonospora sp. RTGN7]|uniref:type I polyketide synthase n=1 Tax=Micromonospora sp. RTGN7 TaxID=3016526 RepID=UPI0029FF4BA0|nr:polyketide synthase [Micromonospora sp. RTGN7]
MAAENKLRDYLKRVTVDLTEARRQLAEAEAGRHEPIAIVGLSCRLPGAQNVDAYWELLRDGRSAVLDDAPDDRYDLDPYVADYGVYTRRGAFLSDITRWDSEFFGSPPREALRMDPQQRLLMELTWEALEDAGTPPARVAGSRTSVMIGFSDTTQYGRLQSDRLGPAAFTDPYAGQGSSASVAAGRLAYHFDLRGPTVTLDTACSSSLVAVHLSSEALRRGESDLAVAGGGFLLIQPDMYVNACATSMLSPDGLNKTFDASADGYVMGEGAGVVVLERLSDALRNGRRIHAVIRGSAVNQDGHSNGMTAPNRIAQVDVIRRALAAARTSPDEICYVEAHGSGTRLGDSIELGALGDVFGGRSAATPLHVGAVKTNIGHTQAAAGIAGLIKTVLVLKQGVIPPNLNLVNPSEAVLASDTVQPVTTTLTLPEQDRPRVAGVSSFGWSGTNAHLVLEAAPQVEPVAEAPGPYLLPVSAHHPAALREQLVGLGGALDGCSAAELAYTLQSGRAEHRYRRAVLATDTADATERITAAAGVAGVHSLRDRPRVAFLLPDAGAGHRGLGGGLYRREPAYAAAVDSCVEIAAERCGLDLRPLLDAGPGAEADPPELAESFHFVVQYALAQLLLHRGVRPDVLVGQGVGEQVANCLAGVLTLTDALLLTSRRARPAGNTASGTEPAEVLDPVTRQTPAITVVTVAADGTDLARQLPHDLDVLVELGAGTVLGELLASQLPGQLDTVLLGTLPGVPGDGDAADVASLLDTCGRLWEIGVTLDWSALRGGPARLADLPTYPFQRQRHWIERPAGPAVVPSGTEAVEVEPASGDAHVRLLTQHWRAAPAGAAAVGIAGRYLLLAPAGAAIATEVADELATRLRRSGGDVVLATCPSDLVALLGAGPNTVVDLSMTQPVSADADAAAVHAASRVLAACGGSGHSGTRVLVVTRGGQAVPGTAGVTVGGAAPAQAAVAALPVVANQEYLDLESIGVDLDPDYGVGAMADALAAELGRRPDGVHVAHRGGTRYLPAYEALATPAQTHPVASGGTYLITGGLGDIGLTLAGHLVRNGAAGLVLTSRRGLPDDPDDPRHAAVAALRALGATVRTPRIDVTDEAAMRALFTDVRIDGVVHAAADAGTDTFVALRDLDEAAVARQFGAKVDGARVIARIVAGLDDHLVPEWCLLFSSTSALLGGVTFGGYAAANAALTALAHVGADGRSRWISAGWDTWACTLQRLRDGIGASMVSHSMSDAEALAAFDRLVGAALPAVVVAAGGLDDRLPRLGGVTVEPVGGDAIRHPRPDLPQPYTPPLTGTERALAELWSDVLGIEPVGIHDNYFDLGGTSLLVPRLLGLVKSRFAVAVPTVSLFEAPTVRSFSTLLDQQRGSTPAEPARAGKPVGAPAVGARPVLPASVLPAFNGAEPALASPVPPALAGEQLDRQIAIVGMAGRFPGAEDVAAFWRSLCAGEELISFFTPEELVEAGVPSELAHDPAYVPARPILADIAGFDAGFFGISPRMAALTDPQQRLFLEVCWEALEQSGYCRPEHRGRVGVFGGTNISTYLLGALSQLSMHEDLSEYELIMGNDKDALTTTVSYLFDLQGPSVAVQTFCSTSLVAVHLAVRSLRSGDCEMALAGGVSIRVPDKQGHLATPGGMESRDGHVHTFDAQASGTMFGDGATVVVLKRLDAALRDGDHVYGVIRGSAMNNDGALKVGYTAPSVAGQARVIVDAMADAGVSPEEISYVEAHGTATELGDPIEVAALTRAFGATEQRQYCPIGAVKTNVGHMNHAAGTAGLIKTSLALQSRVIPPTLHYTKANPAIDFENSPFYVNVDLAEWPTTEDRPRIAGLNSIGMGGTNVHVVVQEPPVRPEVPETDELTGPEHTRRYQVVPVSARTVSAADRTVQRLGEHLADQPGTRLADVAFSLQVGRKTFEHRRVAVTASLDETVGTLTGRDGAAPPMGRVEAVQGRPVAFLLAGVGEQYPGLVGELYRREPVFRAALDECLAPIAAALPELDLADLLTGARGGGADLAALLGRGGGTNPRTAVLRRTEVAQPLLFAVDYALASTLLAWGLRPTAMLGYSLGEYVAACLAGVLSLPDAISLVVYRAKLIGELETGSMAAVPLAADELRRRFRLEQRGLDIAAINGPETVVVAGPTAALDQLAADLRQAEIPCRPLETSHAFHSRMLSGISDQLTAWVAANIRLNPPQLPYISNVTGALADAALVRDPAYWARHMCQPVQFEAGVQVLLADPELALVEIGPGQSLGALVRSAGCPPQRWPLITATLPAGGDPRPADLVLTDALARLWLTGVEIDWAAYHGRGDGATPVYRAAPGRIPLPTYPFERQRYWIEQSPATGGRGPVAELPAEPTSLAEIGRIPRLPEEQWLHLPVWRQTAALAADERQPDSWLVYAGFGATADGVLAELARTATATGARLTVVRAGVDYRADGDGYTIRPGNPADALTMLRALRAAGVGLDRVVHLWTLGELPDDDRTVSLGLHTLVALARAAAELGLDSWALDIVSTGSQQVLDGNEARPASATVLGPVLVIPLEYPSVSTRLVDVEPATPAGAIVAELRRPRTEPTVAIRAGRRWVCGYESIPPADLDTARRVLRDDGVYLITGGLGGIGLGLAGQLTQDCRGTRLVLFGRTGLPAAERWAGILAGSDEVDESTRSRVERVQALVEAGAEVEIVVGDVADPADVRRAVDVARERFGALHGILHTAGVPGTGLMQFKLPTDSDLVLAPKVAGTRAIVEALRVGADDEIRLDFLVLFSSITSATGGGPGQVDYCAANAYLDRYAGMLTAAGRPTLSVDWGEWAWNAWDGGLGGFDSEVQTFFSENRARFGITFEEGWRTLLRALASGESQLVAATQDLATMVRFSRWFNVEAVTAPTGTASSGARHPRPELVTRYQEPAGPTELGVAGVWCDSLKLERVGVADNFFELGGNSLLGIALLNTLRRRFTEAELPPHILYEAPTVAALARVIDGTAARAAAAAEDDGQLRAQLRRSGLKTAAARRRAS